jgi:hypothetical protein
MICGCQTGRPGANNGNTFICFWSCKIYLKAVGQSIVTNEAFHLIDRDRIVMLGPVTF